jgi:SMODS and SLOG-associating 2TM effector domain family 4
MFQLSVVDHIRLSFGHVIQSYRVHSSAAEHLAHRAWLFKTTLLALLGLGVLVSAGLVVNTSRALQVTATVLAVVGFVGYATHLALGLDERVQEHRTCATRFWLIGEKYRALLTEIQDGLLDVPQLRERRDSLIDEVHAAYGQSRDLGAVRLALSPADAALWSDVDAFLPESAQRRNPTAA